jgi:hypothetical protein
MKPAKVIRMLETLDMKAARKLHPDFTDLGLLGGMHKARYEMSSIDPKLRHESAVWLMERGWGRLDGSPLLPLGQLPS